MYKICYLHKCTYIFIYKFITYYYVYNTYFLTKNNFNIGGILKEMRRGVGCRELYPLLSLEKVNR